MNATDRIDYTRPFTENVRGTLYARLRRDADGVPTYELDGADRVYTIDIYLHSPEAPAIYAVTYAIEGMPAPLGSSYDRHNDFRMTIEVSGDSLLLVKVSMQAGHRYEQRAWLSQMLENGYGKDPPAEVAAAIQRIKIY